MGYYATATAPQNLRQEKPTCSRKNASRDFFGTPTDCTPVNRLSSRTRTKEKTPYSYETASGRPVWPSRDPIGEIPSAVPTLPEYPVMALLEFRQTITDIKNEKKFIWNIIREVNYLVVDEFRSNIVSELLKRVTRLDSAEINHNNKMLYEMSGQGALYVFAGNNANDSIDLHGLYGVWRCRIPFYACLGACGGLAVTCPVAGIPACVACTAAFDFCMDNAD